MKDNDVSIQMLTLIVYEEKGTRYYLDNDILKGMITLGEKTKRD